MAQGAASLRYLLLLIGSRAIWEGAVTQEGRNTKQTTNKIFSNTFLKTLRPSSLHSVRHWLLRSQEVKQGTNPICRIRVSVAAFLTLTIFTVILRRLIRVCVCIIDSRCRCLPLCVCSYLLLSVRCIDKQVRAYCTSYGFFFSYK